MSGMKTCFESHRQRERLYWQRISPGGAMDRAWNDEANLTEEHTKCTVE